MSNLWVKLSEVNHVSDTDLPWCLQQDGFAQINEGTTVYPIFYDRHVKDPFIYVSDPRVTEFPWVISPKLVFECPDLPFNSIDPALTGSSIGVNPTAPNVIIFLPAVIVNELQGIEIFGFVVPKGRIVPFIG